ncbi:MAG TPA: hypothetical protein VFQ00_12950 [Terriglobales bacterium]|nr:hypothetical protein [Terriglobales bacterium]
MKDIHEAVRERETQIERLTKEIETLRTAARILEDEEHEVPKKIAKPATTREPVSASTGGIKQFP